MALCLPRGLAYLYGLGVLFSLTSLRITGMDERQSLECLHISYTQGAKNAVSVDIDAMTKKFVIRLFGQVVLDAGPKSNHIMVSCSQL